MKPADRITRLPTQLFSRLISLVDETRNQGIDVINLGQGNPDQPTPEHIVQALKDSSMDPRFHRYISFAGLPELKQAVADWYKRRHGVIVDPGREVAILIGSKIGLEEISLCLLDPGDVAIAPDPGYPDYLSGIHLAGATLHPLPLQATLNFLPDLGDWHPKAKLAFVNYPNNPTGRIAPASFYDELIQTALRYGTVLAHDLAYGDIVYDGRDSVSLLSRPGGKEAGIEFTTLSKSYNMAGWRMGFAAGNADLIHYLELLQDHLHCSQFGAIQQASIAALTGPQDSVRQLTALFQRRRDRFVDTARAHGWDITPSSGSIFLWCKVPSDIDSFAWTDRILRETGVVVAPGRGFGEHGEGYIRISLTEPEHRLEEAARRIAKMLAKSPVS